MFFSVHQKISGPRKISGPNSKIVGGVVQNQQKIVGALSGRRKGQRKGPRSGRRKGPRFVAIDGASLLHYLEKSRAVLAMSVCFAISVILT